MSQIFSNTGKSALREPGIVFHPHLQSVARIFLPGSEIDPQLNKTGGIYFQYFGGKPGFRPGYKRHHKLSTPEELPSNCTILIYGVYFIGSQPTPGLGFVGDPCPGCDPGYWRKIPPGLDSQCDITIPGCDPDTGG